LISGQREKKKKTKAKNKKKKRKKEEVRRAAKAALSKFPVRLSLAIERVCHALHLIIFRAKIQPQGSGNRKKATNRE